MRYSPIVRYGVPFWTKHFQDSTCYRLYLKKFHDRDDDRETRGIIRQHDLRKQGNPQRTGGTTVLSNRHNKHLISTTISTLRVIIVREIRCHITKYNSDWQRLFRLFDLANRFKGNRSHVPFIVDAAIKFPARAYRTPTRRFEIHLE